MEPIEKPADPMEALRARFLARTAEDLETLRACDEPADLRPMIHRLAGSAGTFGFAEISALAGALDDRLHAGERVARADLTSLIAALEAITRPPA
jgi:HPt (histidine-containing phosphotransfer) domain-containing protein